MPVSCLHYTKNSSNPEVQLNNIYILSTYYVLPTQLCIQ